jgi:type I restriction enzyme R subunit
VVDFADIQKNQQNQSDYFNELQSELGDEMEYYSNIFKSQEEINAEIKEIKVCCFILIR